MSAAICRPASPVHRTFDQSGKSCRHGIQAGAGAGAGAGREHSDVHGAAGFAAAPSTDTAPPAHLPPPPPPTHTHTHTTPPPPTTHTHTALPPRGAHLELSAGDAGRQALAVQGGDLRVELSGRHQHRQVQVRQFGPHRVHGEEIVGGLGVGRRDGAVVHAQRGKYRGQVAGRRLRRHVHNIDGVAAGDVFIVWVGDGQQHGKLRGAGAGREGAEQFAPSVLHSCRRTRPATRPAPVPAAPGVSRLKASPVRASGGATAFGPPGCVLNSMSERTRSGCWMATSMEA